MSSSTTSTSLESVPEIVAAQAAAEMAGEVVYVDYVIPDYDYRFNVMIPEYNISVPYRIYHQSRIVKLTLDQAIARQKGLLPIRVPYSATRFPVKVPHTGEIRHCSLDAYILEL